MAVVINKWDVTEHLESEEAIFSYMNAAFEDGDPSLIAAAIGDVARARGMTKIAREAGLSRESLYRALGVGGNPEFATVLKVLHVLGIQLKAEPSHGENDSHLEECA
ncbi:addiction module antidote protein [Phyllobacterium chamaecytisi]|uniref:addiction module antidote protein n=1 Tax=Phyllobacterium chamaecytisi TaxID=2876082 RepID=UPI001CCB315C|nr:addiction module antidote protein [Phyllobacterium sp. KW56]MBZ9600778.1 putative addiction module antidote protein [Phyllobacterium sp. KW56]